MCRTSEPRRGNPPSGWRRAAALAFWAGFCGAVYVFVFWCLTFAGVAPPGPDVYHAGLVAAIAWGACASRFAPIRYLTAVAVGGAWFALLVVAPAGELADMEAAVVLLVVLPSLLLLLAGTVGLIRTVAPGLLPRRREAGAGSGPGRGGERPPAGQGMA